MCQIIMQVDIFLYHLSKDHSPTRERECVCLSVRACVFVCVCVTSVALYKFPLKYLGMKQALGGVETVSLLDVT